MPERVYHYTSLDALRGILGKTICLWATRYDHLNDPHEQIWAESVISSLAQQSPYKDSLTESNYEQWFAKYSYILSLCKKADYRNMWRLYCNDGRGFALGFDAGLLSEISKDNSLKDPQHCYDVFEEIQYTTKDEVKSAIDYWKQKGIFNRNINEPFDELMYLRAFIKDKDFDIEKEIRYARIRENAEVIISPIAEDDGGVGFDFHPDNYNVKYRMRGDEVVPYIELRFPACTLKSITIGYGYRYADMKPLIYNLLAEYGDLYKEVQLLASNLY